VTVPHANLDKSIVSLGKTRGVLKGVFGFAGGGGLCGVISGLCGVISGLCGVISGGVGGFGVKGLDGFGVGVEAVFGGEDGLTVIGLIVLCRRFEGVIRGVGKGPTRMDGVSTGGLGTKGLKGTFGFVFGTLGAGVGLAKGLKGNTGGIAGFGVAGLGTAGFGIGSGLGVAGSLGLGTGLGDLSNDRPMRPVLLTHRFVLGLRI
jgi:hypothetical protein